MIIRKIFHNITEELPTDILWIIDEIIDILNACEIEEVMAKIDKRMLRDRDPFSFFYENFLEKYDPEKRKKLGVYFTPRPVVFFIVNSIKLILKNDFNKNNGFADDDVTVLDPATGTATFLWAIYIATILELRNKGLKGLLHQKIEKHVLMDFYGFEIQIAAYIFAHLKLAATLTEYEYTLKEKDRTQIYLTNTLEPSESHGLIAFMKELNEESRIANSVKQQKKILVILSNPPYFSYSVNNSKWIQDLLKKGYTAKDGRQDAGYYKVDGNSLGEKNPKLLQDDYVKFIRFAQWKIDTAGEGIVGYITNHSYLDNITFRGMRQSLLQTFDRIYILNLHGDVRKRETSPHGGKDENVFESITQGVAISIFVKSKTFSDKRIFYSDLWGKRDQKFDWLDRHVTAYSRIENFIGKDVAWQELSPESPNYFFVPKDLSQKSVYEKFWRISDIFHVHSSAIQTARDNLTIKWNPEEIFETVMKLANLDTDSAKKEFDLKDSQDWKVHLAQKDIKDSGPDKSKISPILYRPFDIRYTYYTGKSRGFIGRPRYAVMQHMFHENLGLITRRQMQKPFNFAFITDKIIAHGVIMSDNKGLERLFPLYVYTNSQALEKKPNIAAELINYLSKLYGEKIVTENIFYYIYAVLYSNKYRKMFAPFLESDFPRIPFSKNFKIFEQMSKLGENLALLHLNRIKFETKTKFNVPGNNRVEFVKFEKQKIFINETQFFDGIPDSVWNYSIGAYNVLDKWLKSRKSRVLDSIQIEEFLQIVEIVKRTIHYMQEIDKIDFLSEAQ